MKSLSSIFITATAAVLPLAGALSLDATDAESIKSASSTLAYGLMSFYKNNQSTTPPEKVGTFPEPLYWWEGGAVWGGMVDYWSYTGDSSYVETTQEGLLAQTGPDNNFMPPSAFSSLGNDDQAFWGIAALAAAEYGFPVPEGKSSSLWLELAENVFNSQVPRWNASSCDGGIAWQIFESNPHGMSYKNSISNGALFQMAARLAYHTGNNTYLEWGEKIWNWMSDVGLIDDQYNVFDGTDSYKNCTEINRVLFSYNPSMLLYGAAVLYNHTGGSGTWQERTTGLLQACSNTFFSPYPNATDIAYEWACETHGTCNNDQYSFKAYLARWLSKSAIVAPYISDSVFNLMNASSIAAAQSCSGGDSGSMCGQKWYVGGYDGNSGVGQQLSALETVQSLLLLQGNAIVSQIAPSTQKGTDGAIEEGKKDVQSSPGKGAGGKTATINRNKAETELCAGREKTWPCRE